MRFYFLKGSTTKSIIESLIGRDTDFKAEHQFFNVASLLGVLFYIFFILVNIVFKVDYMLTIVKTAGALSCATLYYFSRFKHQLAWTSFSFFLIVLTSYLFIGVKNGGVTGGIAPIYIAVLTFMLFIMDGIKKNILLGIWILSITSLFVIEYSNPSLITPYSNEEQKYIDIFLSYFSGIIMVAFVVVTVKKLFKKERLNVEELIDKYRSSGSDLKQIISSNLKLLTVRERDICKLLLKGFSNKEIADELFITEGTVKSHLNKIFKKLGATNRVDVINIMDNI